MLETALLIALPLALPIGLDHGRDLLSALSLIVGVLVPPLPLTIAHHLAIDRIGVEFLAVILGAPLALALRLAADQLLRAIDGRRE